MKKKDIILLVAAVVVFTVILLIGKHVKNTPAKPTYDSNEIIIEAIG